MKRLALIAFLVACGSKGQTFEQGWTLVCSIPTLPVSAIADVTMRQAEINKWFKVNVTNAEAVQKYLEISTVPPTDRRAYISNLAKGAGVEHCALAAFYNPAPASVPIPK